jgi:hypothetical protein
VVKSYATLCNAHANAASQQMLQEVEKPNGCEHPQPASVAGYNSGIFYDEWQSTARLKGKCESARFRTMPAFHPQPVGATGPLPRPKYETRGGVIADVARQSLASTLQA